MRLRLRRTEHDNQPLLGSSPVSSQPFTPRIDGVVAAPILGRAIDEIGLLTILGKCEKKFGKT